MAVAAPAPGLSAPAAPAAAAASDSVAGALRTLLEGGSETAVHGLYRTRAYRPLWIDAQAPTAEAAAAVRLLQDADHDGLNPAAYRGQALAQDLAAARAGGPAALARFDVALTRALADYAADLRTPSGPAAPLFTDPGLQPPADARADALRTAAAAPAGARLSAFAGMNPIYLSLRQSYMAAAPGSEAARLALANMERVRALPVDLGSKFLIVDLAAQRLWMHEAGQPARSMKVVVGKPASATPALVGLLRHAVFRPYWNVPPDLAQERAVKVLASGPGYLADQNIEALSDWSRQAQVLPLEEVDWAAAADGRQPLRLRQKPGPANMMGQVKFIFPNDHGIYLHDTPVRAHFRQAQRIASAGCVRLEDAPALARWLMGAEAAGAAFAADGPPENQVALVQPVPVYLLYLTAAPAGGPLASGRLERRADVYGQDRPKTALASSQP